MDKELTKGIEEWLNTPPSERNLEAGAKMLLQLNRNKIMYNNIMRAPKRYADILEYNLKKWFNLRVTKQTHSDVEKMAEEVHVIAERNNLTLPPDNTEGFKKGKRGDHDSLPDEIQALYVENLSLLQRMREVHLRLRLMSEEHEDGSICPDSDRYPFLQEIIKLDKKYRDNWKRYDTFTKTDGEAIALASEDEADKKNVRLINLAKGKYKKKPSPELKEKIIGLFNSLCNPSEKMRAELIELNII